MESSVSYTVIIRTLNGGEGYSSLLQSISKQLFQPEHVYVVQPYGFDPPKEQLGNEEYIHTNKGMWEQRIYGMEFCLEQSEHSKYLLVCDDDVMFDENFSSVLIKLSEQNFADIMIPIDDIKLSKLKKFLFLILGESTENKSIKYRIEIKNNGRFRFNNHLSDNINPTQSGAFQCFLMRTDITPKLKLREEMWLDDTRYAWPDDQVFFYKSYLIGLNVLSCRSPMFVHLDGKSGTASIQRKFDLAYSSGRNVIIFWSKFVLPYQKSMISRVTATFSFAYFMAITGLKNILWGIKFKKLSIFCAYLKGVKSGYKYSKSIGI